MFLSQIDPREKTIVFCATQEHALAVRDLINQLKRVPDPNYCERVTAEDGELGEQHLKAFQDNERTIPTILTTSQKLSTGVDARNVRNIVLMRPVNSMIEFKQIIGRGTRLFDGKDYFTIHDFVKAYEHFSDPEWDGPPQEPEACGTCGSYPCVCEPTEPKLCKKCGERACICPPEPCEVCGQIDCVCERKGRVKVKLADGKEREIQHMMMTTFWHTDGKPMSSREFMELLFGKLPDLFADEAELRSIWSNPSTRAKLLNALSERGFGSDQLAEMKRLIRAENSDLFDVLLYVRANVPPMSREARAARAKPAISVHFNEKQRTFLEFVLAQYVAAGVDELSPEKLPALLKLKYDNAIADAVADLGPPSVIGEAFVGFQVHIYQP